MAGESSGAMQLRKSVSVGHVPANTDVHSLAGLIKVRMGVEESAAEVMMEEEM